MEISTEIFELPHRRSETTAFKEGRSKNLLVSERLKEFTDFY
jgi:hypothetical protein